MTTVFINFQEDEITSSLEVQINAIIKLDASFVGMANYLNENELGILIQFEHQQLISHLNLTELSPYVLLFFDEALNFKGAA